MGDIDSSGPVWHQRLRWFPLIGAVVTGGMACLMPVAAVKSVTQDKPAVFVGAVAMTIMFAFATVGLSAIAGFRYRTRSKRIVACRDEIGSGLVIPSRRHLIPILVCLGSAAVIGLVVAAGWFLGADIGPLAAGNRGEAQFLAAGGIIAAASFAAFLGFRSSAEIRLYPSGVRRIITLRRLWSTRTIDTLVSWDDIVEFRADEQVVGGTLEVRNPIVWLVSETAIEETGRRRFDDANRLRLDAHNLVAEPNALLALLSSLRASPDLRGSLADAQAPTLLTPLPLRSRLWPRASAKA